MAQRSRLIWTLLENRLEEAKKNPYADTAKSLELHVCLSTEF